MILELYGKYHLKKSLRCLIINYMNIYIIGEVQRTPIV